MNLKKVLYLGLASLMVASVGISSASLVRPALANSKRISRHAKVSRNHKKSVQKKRVARQKDHKQVTRKARSKKKAFKDVDPAKAMRKPISYRKSSETIPYPKNLSARKDRIVVSLKKQHAYLMHGKKLLYEFYVSTGKNVRGRRTPKGHYRINGVHSSWFYAPSEHEGARYAVGWHDGGLYLFHETPSNVHKKIIKSVARDLGRKGSSYGCVHLSTSDAKWFYYHIPTGMRVIIR